MKVKALEKEWVVSECTYAQRRELHRKNAKAFWNPDEPDVEAYYKMLDRVAEIAGLSEQDFKGLSMTDVDEVLQAVFMEYAGLSPKG